MIFIDLLNKYYNNVVSEVEPSPLLSIRDIIRLLPKFEQDRIYPFEGKMIEKDIDLILGLPFEVALARNRRKRWIEKGTSLKFSLEDIPSNAHIIAHTHHHKWANPSGRDVLSHLSFIRRNNSKKRKDDLTKIVIARNNLAIWNYKPEAFDIDPDEWRNVPEYGPEENVPKEYYDFMAKRGVIIQHYSKSYLLNFF